jgi:hypothetical protein
VDMKTTLGLGKLYKEERVSADNNATTVELGKQDVQKTQIAADKEIKLGEQKLESQPE